MIYHCIKASTWTIYKTQDYWGVDKIALDGFIHCTQKEHLPYVFPTFATSEESLVILVIDENQLEAPVTYEAPTPTARAYPHIYGLVNQKAVVAVLDYLKDSQGQWLMNPEIESNR